MLSPERSSDTGIYAEGPNRSDRDEVHVRFVVVGHGDPFPRFGDVFPDIKAARKAALAKRRVLRRHM